MKKTFVVSALSFAALMLGQAGCNRAKEDVAAKPAADSAKPAAANAMAAVAALPKLGPAPKWTLKDVNGADVTSEQFKGKVVVIDFWATWCPPCREEIPGYVALAQKYGQDGLVIIGISLDQGGPEVVKDFAKKYKINYPLVMGDDTVVAAFGGVEAIPTTLLIDRDGQVRDRKLGMVEKEEYEKRIVAALKG
jgi:peroxiredoxin